MKKTAYIHIGMPKTGTTAIQSTLNRFFNEGKLDRFDMQLHHLDTWRLTRDFRVTEDEEYFVEQVRKNILKYSRKLGEKNIIFSNEFLATRYFSGHWSFVYDFLPLLANAFEGYNIKVIIYLRRQDLLIESLVNQSEKIGHHTSCNNECLCYNGLIEKCVENFGENSVIARKYERESLYKNDSVSDFLHVVGLDDLIDDYLKNKGKSINSSLSPSAFRIAMADNKQYQLRQADIEPKIKEYEDQYKNALISREEYIRHGFLCLIGFDESRGYDKLPSVRANLLRGNSNFSVGSSSYGYLSPEERAEILAKYADGNAAVAREYFGREDGKLFTDKVPTNIVDINTEPSTTDIVQTFMPILIDLTQRCERLEMSPLKRFILDRKENFKRVAEKLERFPKLHGFLYKIFWSRK